MFKEVVIVPSGVFLQLFLGREGEEMVGLGGGVVQKVKGLCHLFDMNVISKKSVIWFLGSYRHNFF